MIRWAKPLLAAVLFVAAVQGIGASADALEPTISRWLEDLIEGPTSALGAGWLVTYLLTNGSVVAGLAVTLVESEAVEASQGFLILAGSRLGSAAFIVLIGIVEFARARPRPPLRRALGLGFLTYLVTLSVYVPATVLGYSVFGPLRDLITDALPSEVDLRALDWTGDIAGDLVEAIGPIPVSVMAAVLVIVSLQLFDQFLAGIDEDRLRARARVWLRWPAISFASGLVVTALTTSVSLSIGALVPLYSRRIVKTSELIPYLLGAGLGTVADTVLFALVLGSEPGLAVVLILAAGAAVMTLVYLTRMNAYSRFVERIYERFTADALGAIGSVLLLLAAPILLFIVR